MASGNSGITNLGLRVRSAVRTDESADRLTLYWGEAPAGSLTSSASWSIARVTFDSLSSSIFRIEWADGNTLNDNIWDNRISLTYL